MERVYGRQKTLRFAQDVIRSMPESVVTNIMNRLPLRDAMRTSILLSNWRFMWTMLTQLVFDKKFPNRILGVCDLKCYYERSISRILYNLTGPIMKFYLYIPNYKVLDVNDLSHWVMFLSRKGIQVVDIWNKHHTPLALPSHLFSCLKLKHLTLTNCCFHLPLSFRSFPNLLSLDLNDVRIESHKGGGELMTWCPLLEDLRISYNISFGKVNLVDILKLENLRVLFLPLCKLDSDTMSVTSSSIFQLVRCFLKLQELHLEFGMCKLLAEARAKKDVSTTFPYLKTLGLGSMDFGNDRMVSLVFEMIRRLLNLQNLRIVASKDSPPPSAHSFSEVDYNTMRQLQLRSVKFVNLRGSENEVWVIKCLLSCSHLLNTISIELKSSSRFYGADERLNFAEKLEASSSLPCC